MRRLTAALSIAALALGLVLPKSGFAAGVELSTEPKELQVQAIPDRPQPLELGNSFLGVGPIAPGFTIPTGATWQPQLLVWGTIRSAVQTSTRTGFSEDRSTAWVNRVDIFTEFEVSPTERIVVGWRPMDQNANFTGCVIEQGNLPFEEGCDAAWNGVPHIAFLEGNFSELFPNLDPSDSKNLDIEFSVGRQLFLFQDGMLIGDFMDGLAITKNNIPLGTNTRVLGMVSLNGIDRFPGSVPANPALPPLPTTDQDAILSMVSMETDFARTSMNLDAVYVNSRFGDSVHVGLSFIQRIRKLNVAIRGLYSNAIDGNNEYASTGGIIMAEFNYVLASGPRVTHDQVYSNVFVGINEFSSAARDQGTGGPLGRVGLLFAGVGMGPSYAAPIPNIVDDTWGGVIGGEKFFNNGRDVLAVEFGGRHDWNRENLSTVGLGGRYQHALGRHIVLRIDAFATGRYISKGLTPAKFGWGSRGEILFKF